MEIILYNLPKISLNKWYSGNHWTKRKKIKDIYKLIVKSQFKAVLSKEKKYIVKYVLTFKSRPLDPTNAIAIIKLIEDIIFEDDNYKIIDTIQIQSRKGKQDSVYITIDEI